MSGPKARDTNAAARAVTPPVASSSRRARVAATASASDASLSTAWVSSSSCRPSAARHRPTATSPSSVRAVPRREQHGAALLASGREPRTARRVERGVLPQHAGLELLERGRGLEPERLDEGGASRAEHLERLGLPAGAVERDHQLAAQALVERMLAHEPLELGDELGAAAELELGLEALLRDREAQLAQALDDRPRERLEREIGERLAPPEGERLPVEPDGRLGVAGRERRARGLARAVRRSRGRARPARTRMR